MTRPARIAVVAAGVLLSVVCVGLLAAWWWLSRMEGMPQPRNTDAYEWYGRIGGGALGLPRSSWDPDMLVVHGVSPKDMASRWSVSGFEAKLVVKLWMPAFTDRPLGGYDLQMFGRLSNVPDVEIGGGSEPLWKVARGSYANAPSYAGRAKLLGSSPAFDPPRKPAKHTARLWKASPGAECPWVFVTPGPVFEEDRFEHGRWLGTFAVFRTPQEAARATIHLIPGGAR